MQDGDIMTYTKIRFLHPQAPIELDWVVTKSSGTSENIHQAVLANLFVLRVDSWRFAGDFYLWCLRNPLTGSVCVLNARVTLSSAATKHERP